MRQESALNVYLNSNEDERYRFVKGLLDQIAVCEMQLSGMAEAFKKRSQIRYSPEWIDKILSGEKTMTIRRTQYACGIYDVVNDAEPEKVVCQIEVVKVEKWDTDYWLRYMATHQYYNWADVRRGGDSFSNAGSWDGWGIPPSYQKFPCFVKLSGFSGISCFEDFEDYHRENYAPVKFAHTFQLVKGDML